MKLVSNYRFSLASKLLLAFTIIAYVISFFNNGRVRNVFYGDALGYYQYLPCAFIYHNYDSIEKLPLDSLIGSDIYSYYNDMAKECNRGKNGRLIFNYTYGTAFATLPVFLVVHASQKLTGQVANGYTNAYELVPRITTVLFLFLGLLYCFRLLVVLYDASIALVSTCLLLLGTNLFWFGAYQTGMAHVPIFAFNAILLWHTHQLYHNGGIKLKDWLGIGISVGLIIASRTIDVLFVAVPVLYGISSVKDIKDRINLLQKNKIKFLLCLASAIAIIAPQLIYWWVMTGQVIFNTYANSKFYWSNPQLIKGWFSAHNGWLYYTPLMAFAILGFFCKATAVKRIRVLGLVLIPVYCYVIYSWWCWGYINGLGSRPMIHLYPLLAIALCAFIDCIVRTKHAIVRIAACLLALLLVFANLRLSWLNQNKYIISDFNNKLYAYSQLFNFSFGYADLCSYDTGHRQPNDDDISTKSVLATWPNSAGSERPYSITRQNEYPDLKLDYRCTNDTLNTYTYIKFGGRFLAEENVYTLWQQPALNIAVKRAGETKLQQRYSINNKLGKVATKEPFNLYDYKLNSWEEMYCYAHLNSGIHKGDVIEIYIDNTQHNLLKIDSLYLLAGKK
jgi:hypothetical protein